MRVVVVGATGHVGSFLVPRLVRAGHEVVALSRGTRQPYVDDPAWEAVRRVVVDREAEDAAGTFGARVADLAPDAVVDMVCFTAGSARQLADALSGHAGHLLHAGSIWAHGRARAVPLREEDRREPFGGYGTAKSAIEDLLLARSRRGGVPATVVHPGHISGPGWPAITPLGNLDERVWTALATGRELVVPGDGGQLMHHVHADDVARVFQAALERPSASVGEAFFAISDRGWSVRGLATEVAGWFGREPVLRESSWEELRAVAGDHADTSWEHLVRSQSASPDKAATLLGCAPRRSSPEVLHEALGWLVDHDRVDLGGARLRSVVR